MFVYVEDKLYVRKGDKLVGVHVTPISIVEVSGTECEMPTVGDYRVMTPDEMKRAMGIYSGGEYKFPVPVKRRSTKTVADEGVEVKPKTTRKRTTKK